MWKYLFISYLLFVTSCSINKYRAIELDKYNDLYSIKRVGPEFGDFIIKESESYGDEVHIVNVHISFIPNINEYIKSILIKNTSKEINDIKLENIVYKRKQMILEVGHEFVLEIYTLSDNENKKYTGIVDCKTVRNSYQYYILSKETIDETADLIADHIALSNRNFLESALNDIIQQINAE